MNKLLLKLGSATTGALMVGMLFAPAALADVSCTISGNGADSHNTCTVTVKGGSSCHRHKCGGGGSTNIANVQNGVWVFSNTGGNTANKNTGGDVTIMSGDSNVNVTITNSVNNNNQ